MLLPGSLTTQQAGADRAAGASVGGPDCGGMPSRGSVARCQPELRQHHGDLTAALAAGRRKDATQGLCCSVSAGAA